MSKQLVSVAVVGILIGAVGVAVWKDREVLAIKERLAKQQADNAKQALEIDAMNARPKTVPSRQQPSFRAPPAAVVMTNNPAAAGYPTDSIERAKRDVEMAYGQVLRRITLTDAQRAQLNDLLMDRRDAANAARRAVGENRIAASGVEELIKQLQAEIDQQIHSKMDGATYEIIQRMLENEGTLQRAEGVLKSTKEAPFTAFQLTELARIFNDSLKRGPLSYEITPASIDPSTGLAEPDRRIIAEASSTLTPAQLNTLQEQLAFSRSRSVAIHQAQKAIADAYKAEESSAKETPKN